jgi:aliphatic nitrilase
MEQRIKVCAAHVAPVFLDADATVAKACDLIGEAAANGARLIAFPESYVPGFPVWASLRAPIYNHEYFKEIAGQSIEVPGPLTDQLCNAARRHQVFVSVGISEGTRASVGCLWNSNLLIGEDGSILNHHRKIVPTFYEKLVWANGDGAGLRVVESLIGRLGMLICGENTNPLARYALIAQGEQVHVSSYPPVWPTRDPAEGGNYDLAAAIRIRAGAHSFEGKLFNVVASAFLDEGTIRALEPAGPDAIRILRESPRGISVVIGPSGLPVSDTLCDDEGLLYHDVDLGDCVEPKQFHDVAGYYNRFDIFKLTVNRSANMPLDYDDIVSARPASFDPPAEEPAPSV